AAGVRTLGSMEQQAFSRRRFLKLALLGGGSLFAAGALWRFWPRKTHGRLLSLNSYLADVVEAFAGVTLPQNGMPDATAMQIVRRLDEELTFVAEQIRSDFLAALYLVEFSPAAYGFFGRMSRLTREKRLAFLQKAGGSGSDLVRAAISNIRMLVMLCYYGHPASWKRIGYDGPFGGFPEKLSEQRRFYREQVAEKS
ncbi:MAG TPA: hypothetical protein PKW28_13995, partial [Turneriella sp.]|nr:hypothetical protein [Turneriella sp.]